MTHELARSLAHKWRKKRCAAPIRCLRDAIELAHPLGNHEWRWCGAELAHIAIRVADTPMSRIMHGFEAQPRYLQLPVGINCKMRKPRLPEKRRGKAGNARVLLLGNKT